MTENTSPSSSATPLNRDPSLVILPEQAVIKENPVSPSTGNRIHSYIGHIKKLPLRMAIGILAIFVLVTGGAAAFYLSGTSSELRQQASGGYLQCAGGVNHGEKACSGLRTYVTCQNGSFGAASTCSGDSTCQGGNCIPASEPIINCFSGSNCIEREVAQSECSAARGYYTTQTACNAAASDPIISCFSGSNCTESRKTRSACDLDRGHTSRLACTSAASQRTDIMLQGSCSCFLFRVLHNRYLVWYRLHHAIGMY